MIHAAELKRHADRDLERIACQLGISMHEIRRLVGHGPDAAKLLSWRMAALDVDPAKVARIEPQVSEDLRENCARCHSRRRCLADLARDCSDFDWDQYCPDAATMLALSALPWMTRRTGW